MKDTKGKKITDKEKQDKLISELKDAMQHRDWEVVHGIYDDLMRTRLNQHEPSFIKMLDKLTKGADFWYA